MYLSIVAMVACYEICSSYQWVLANVVTIHLLMHQRDCLLLQPISGPQEGWGTKTSYQSEIPK